MQKEQDPLNLRSLPLVEPPGDDWPVIEAALLSRCRQRRARRLAMGTLAAAATIALAIGLTVNAPFSGTGSDSPPAAAEQMAQTEAASTPRQEDFAAGNREGPTLDSLIALSQQLETRIRSLRSEAGGLPTQLLIYQVELEDLVAQVDDELSMNPESLRLWSQRVNLLLDLNQLYQNQLRRDYHRMASL